jgi:hypothetical protein
MSKFCTKNDKTHGNARLINREIKSDDIESSTWRISLHSCRSLAVDTGPSVRLCGNSDTSTRYSRPRWPTHMLSRREVECHLSEVLMLLIAQRVPETNVR